MPHYKRKKTNLPSSTNLARVAIAAASILALFFIVRAIVRRVGTPSLHADEVKEVFESKRALIRKINQLENTVRTYQTQADGYALLQKENDALKAELGRGAAAKGTLARVLTTPERNFYDTLIIDAGSADGIQDGQIAYAFGSIALGTVTSTDTHRSTVQLFSAADRQIFGNAEGSDVALTLIGRGGGEYEVRMPRDMHFEIGETISYQSIHTAVLAKIEKIATDPRDPFQRLLAKAPVNLTALKFVIVR